MALPFNLLTWTPFWFASGLISVLCRRDWAGPGEGNSWWVEQLTHCIYLSGYEGCCPRTIIIVTSFITDQNSKYKNDETV